MTPMTWMGRRDAKPKKGVKARIPFLGLVTVVTASYFLNQWGEGMQKECRYSR
jgi:hypothetical protein